MIEGQEEQREASMPATHSPLDTHGALDHREE